MRGFLLLVAVLAARCGRPVPVTAPGAPDPRPSLLARAEDSAAEGCYECLTEALRSYEEALALRHEPIVAHAAYRVAVQLALRERLLGIYPGPHQGSPDRLMAGASTEDRAAAPDVLRAVPWRRNTLGPGLTTTPGAADIDVLRQRRDALEQQADEDPWVATLLLALIGTNSLAAVDDEAQLRRGPLPRLDPDRWWARHPQDPGLSLTRLALLPGTTADDWRLLLQQAPRMVEAWVYIGDAEIGRGRLVSADEALALALEALPALLPARVLRGDIQQRMEDYRSALASYDGALARLATHREALSGRLTTLGRLTQHLEAIAVADQLIAMGVYYQAEAHYWKAWNLFHLSRLPEARAMLDQARRLQVSSDVSYLGGVIAHRQDRLDDALADFDAALSLEPSHCEAHFDRAAIFQQRRHWAVSSTGFDEAFACLAGRAAPLAQAVEEARAGRLTEALREALVARREQAVRDNRAQQAWARYNGAVAHANAGRPARARTYAAETITLGGPAAEAAQRLVPLLSP